MWTGSNSCFVLLCVEAPEGPVKAGVMADSSSAQDGGGADQVNHIKSSPLLFSNACALVKFSLCSVKTLVLPVWPPPFMY